VKSEWLKINQIRALNSFYENRVESIHVVGHA